jgi:tetratricopeptide (TPR) repeat protein
MQEERDLLVKRVFPELRRRCRERMVDFVEVDLRWGVTEEQAERGEVLPVCLAEIERCRPFFVGLFGERYGWVPQRIPEELRESHQWLGLYPADRSVTELEVVQGVLVDPRMTSRALFYFRDPAYLDRVAPERRADFRCESDVARAKLEALKARIRASGLPLLEGYADPESVAERILEDLWAGIEREYPAGSEPDALDREVADHEAFAASRARVYVPRQAAYDLLDRHAGGRGSEPPLVVVGESGAGKSALLANWALRYRDAHPGELVLMHFIGATGQSADWTAMLGRILGELKRRFGIPERVPEQPAALRAALAHWLRLAAAKGRLVLVLDGLDQLEDRDRARDLVWLPEPVPAGVRVVVSTLPGRSLDALRARGCRALEVEGLRPEECAQAAVTYLQRYGKRLSELQVARIAAAGQAANPLFLRVLLEELRVLGIHEELDARIDLYLAARTVPELYSRVLARLETDYEKERPGLVREALSLLWAARRGLTESELLALLGTPERPLPRAVWSPFYLAIEESLVRRSGVLGFFHDHLRRAVEERLLPSQDARAAMHRRLAAYFEGVMRDRRHTGAPPTGRIQALLREAGADAASLDARTEQLVRDGMAGYVPGEREIDELPWHLAQTQEWARLFDLLAQPDVAATAWLQDRYSLLRFWTQIEAHTSLRMVDAYAPVLEEPGRHAVHLADLARLLGAAGHAKENLTLHEALVAHHRQAGNLELLAFSLENLAVSLINRGEMQRAVEVQEEAGAVYRRLGKPAPLGTLLLSQGDVLRIQGRLREAMACYTAEEETARRTRDDARLADALGNQALVHAELGQPRKAAELHLAEERICRDLGDLDGLQISLGNRASVHRTLGQLDVARSLLEEKQGICEETGNARGMALAWSEQALVSDQAGRSEEALVLLDRAILASRELDAKHLLQTCLGNRGGILIRLRRYEEAMEPLQEQQRLAAELGDPKEQARCLANQALVLEARGELARALEMMREQERICRQLGNPQGLAIALINQAKILLVRFERVSEAREKALEAHRLATQHGLAALARQMAPILNALGIR